MARAPSLRITRTADCGVRLMTRLAAAQPGERLTLPELARASGASVPFTRKLLQRLARARLIASRRGYEGGFELARPADRISVLDIVTALGPLCLNEGPAEGSGPGGRLSGGADDVWVRAQEALAAVLRDESLAQLAAAAMVSQ